jgi:hypothetical protein
MTLPAAILHVLVAARRALPPEVIRAECNAFLRDAPTLSDVKAELHRLAAMEPPLVRGTARALGGNVWAATPDGRLEVLE